MKDRHKSKLCGHEKWSRMATEQIRTLEFELNIIRVFQFSLVHSVGTGIVGRAFDTR